MSRITNVLDLFVFALVLAVLVQLQNSFCSSSKELTLDDVNEEETSITQDNSTSSQHDPCRKCHKMHRGILRRVTDPDNFSEGCLVYAVLHCDTFDLIRGKTKVNSFNVPTIVTPILLTPGSHLCFMVKAVGNEGPEVLCAENLNCRNEWWTALTRAVLCAHHGTKLRYEIAGDPIAEEKEEMVAEKAVNDPGKGGINIKLSGISEMPVVRLHKKFSATSRV